MIAPGWGKSSVETAWAWGFADDPFIEEESALRSNRQLLAGGGSPTYLLTDLPSNDAWIIGEGYGWQDVRLNRAASSVKPIDIATPNFEMNFVTEVPGRYTGLGVTRPNEWALVDPYDDFVQGDVPLWAQEEVPAPEPYYESGGYGGGW